MARTGRDRPLTVFAVLFAMLAVSNLVKPLHLGSEGEVARAFGGAPGFVFFGQRLAGTASALAAMLFGVFQLVYAAAIWRMRRVAVPMARAYAMYVVVNQVLFHLRNTGPLRVRYVIADVVYTAVGIGISVGAAYLLTRRKEELA